MPYWACLLSKSPGASRSPLSGSYCPFLFDFLDFVCSNNYCILMVSDPPSCHIAKTSVWAPPPTNTHLLTRYCCRRPSGAKAIALCGAPIVRLCLILLIWFVQIMLVFCWFLILPAVKLQKHKFGHHPRPIRIFWPGTVAAGLLGQELLEAPGDLPSR